MAHTQWWRPEDESADKPLEQARKLLPKLSADDVQKLLEEWSRLSPAGAVILSGFNGEQVTITH